MREEVPMSVLARISGKFRRVDLVAPNRATCLRCRREYTLEPAAPDATSVDLYCWWCSARVNAVALPDLR
jgi:hypothetical protein